MYLYDKERNKQTKNSWLNSNSNSFQNDWMQIVYKNNKKKNGI